MSSTGTVLTLPSTPASKYAASSLLIQSYIAPYISDFQLAEGSELSLKAASGSSSDAASKNGFLPIFKQLLTQADQLDHAYVNAKQGSEDEKAIDKWIHEATSASDSAENAAPLNVKELDEHLKNKTYIAAARLSAADVAVYAALSNYIAQANHDTRLSHPNVTRHFDLLQNTSSVTTASSKLSPNLVSHQPISIDLDNVPLVERKYESSKKDKKEKEKKEAGATATPADGKAATVAGQAKAAVKAAKGKAADATTAPASTEGGAATPKASKKEKKAAGGGGGGGDGGKGGKAPAAAAEIEAITPGLIDLRVGKIIDVKKHPDADSLYVETIDIGEPEPRTVVSGLVNYIPIEEMQGKVLICVCNLKPAAMRGIKSFAMVLAATSPDGKEGMGSVELVAPPEGSSPGDRVYFEGFESVQALPQLPPKKKIFETIQPGFTTLEGREAAWIDPADKSKVSKIRTEKGYCKAPNFIGASLS